MLNSILTVKIVEGRNLKTSGNQAIVVVMNIEGQRASTEPLLVQPGKDPVWKEIITFDIMKGRENLLIELVDARSGKVLGQGEVYLDILKDQYKHEEWIQLEEPGSRTGAQAGRILFNLHWIYSKRKFL